MSDNPTENYTADFLSKFVSNDLRTYKDFADDDLLHYKADCQNSIFSNAMGATAQNIAEKYLKHIIDTYAIPETEDEENRKRITLRTHNLRVLVSYITRDMGLDMPLTLQNNLLVLDGLYFTTRYPGDNTIQLTVGDILKYLDILETCKHYVESVIIEQEHP